MAAPGISTWCCRLEAGGIFPLSGCSLDDIKLQLQVGGEHRVTATGRLGILKRNRAIKMAEPMEGALREALDEALAEE